MHYISTFCKVSELQISNDEILWRSFYNLDILEFAGVAFIFLAILEKFIKNAFMWMIIGAIFALTAPYLWGIGENWGIWYNFVQPLWGNKFSPHVPGDTSFPVFPWLVYPIAGVIIGKSLSAGISAQTLLKKMLIAGMALLLLGAVIVIIKTTEQFGDYWRMFPGGTSMVLGFALVWTAFFIWLAQKGLFQKALSHLIFWSENITLIYCVQWVLFGFSAIFLGYKQINNVWILLALIPVYIIPSYLAAVALKRSGSFTRSFRWFTK